jgi:hypothetical protein
MTLRTDSGREIPSAGGGNPAAGSYERSSGLRLNFSIR